jgi:hypothetical protein
MLRREVNFSKRQIVGRILEVGAVSQVSAEVSHMTCLTMHDYQNTSFKTSSRFDNKEMRKRLIEKSFYTMAVSCRAM